MLVSLSIRDFVLVEQLDVDFSAGFTALTGETGAGKSILLDALGLTCGAKADAAQVRVGASRAEITATFSIAPKSPAAVLLKESASDDDSGHVLLRRVIEAEGRSRAFINGRPAAVNELRALGELLVDVHAQHEHQSLTKPVTQRELLDAYSNAKDEREHVARAWGVAQTAKRAVERALTEADVLARERDDVRERESVLRALAPSAQEWTRLGEEQRRIANAQTLMDAASEAVNTMDDADDALRANLERVAARLRAAAKFDPTLDAFAEMVETAVIQVDEAAHGLRSYVEKFDIDPDHAQEVEARMSAMHQAARRFRVPVEQLEGLLAQSSARLAELAESEDIAALENKAKLAQQALFAACEALTAKRAAGAKKLDKAVSSLIKELALGNARFEVQLLPHDVPSATGAEEVQFRFSSHPTLALQPIQKSASGGELARIALAIMVAAANADGVPTLVFDEVDVGIGGGVASVVGANLRSLGRARQVFAVTHQAQVAAHADHHFAVRKRETKAARGVQLDGLDANARTEELARMMAGFETTAATRALASEMLTAVHTAK